ALATSMQTLIIARAVQGASSCGAMVSTYAMIRDLYDEKKRVQVYAYVNGTVSLAPALAPLLGSCLVYYFASWRANFYFLTIYALACFIIVLLYTEETKPSNTRMFGFKFILKNYYAICTNPQFYWYLVPAVAALSSL